MIKKEFNIIMKLSGVFLKDSYQNLYIFNSNNGKLNKKSIFLWMILIFLLGLMWVSEKVIGFLAVRGQAEIFINIFFSFLSILIMFQTILICTNIFYFSKDIERILPLPLRPEEILLSKFITLICRIYISELLFAVIPLIIYGAKTGAPFLFYIYLIIILLLFPIFLVVIVNIVMMFVMKASKFIKNKDLFQIFITFILIIILSTIEYIVFKDIFIKINTTSEIQIVEEKELLNKFININNNIKESNNHFLVINPCIEVLKKSNISSILHIIKVSIIDFVSLFIFVLIGKITYLKDILRNNAYLLKKNKKKSFLLKKCKKRNKGISYIFKEFKKLIKNPMFLMQSIYPVIVVSIIIIIVSISFIPQIKLLIQKEEFKNQVGEISFDLNMVYVILGIIQIIFVLSPISLTSISREGKAAIFFKYIPIRYDKQFLYKGIPQIIINTFPILVILGVFRYAAPSVDIKYLIYIFILAYLLNIINSYAMLIIDLINPKLKWDTEYALLKQNNNKIFQYVFTIASILLLIYESSVFEKINMDLSILLTGIIYLALIILIICVVKIKSNKLFKKII